MLVRSIPFSARDYSKSLIDKPSAALEKILRLSQSLSQILAAYATTAEDTKTWLLLRRQFALGSSLLSKSFHFFSKLMDVHGREKIFQVLQIPGCLPEGV
jgi:hypothetical protein